MNGNSLENKYFKVKNSDFYFKTGKIEHQVTHAAIVCEILDYAGKIDSIVFDPPVVRLDNKIIAIFNYDLKLKSLEEISESDFYQTLADKIMEFIVRKNFAQMFEYEEVGFNLLPERRALLSKIKIPLIIKETIS